MLYYTLSGLLTQTPHPMPKPPRKTEWLDGAAVLLSALCLLHCLALPLIVAGLPLLAQYSDTHLHAQVLVVVIPLSVAALGLGFRHHRKAWILWAGAAGLAILVAGATVAHASFGARVDSIVTVCGSIVLAVAHYYNSRGTREPLPSTAH